MHRLRQSPVLIATTTPSSSSLSKITTSITPSLESSRSSIAPTGSPVVSTGPSVVSTKVVSVPCEHLADYLEAYWKATHPPSGNLPNPLLSRTLASSTLPLSPTLASNSQGSQGDQRPDRSAPRSASQAEEEPCLEPVKKSQHRSSSATHQNHRSGTGRGLSRQETFDSETQESRDSAYVEPKEDYSHEHVDRYVPHREHNHREETHSSNGHRHRESRHRSRDMGRDQDHNECIKQRSRHKSKDRYCDKEGEVISKRRNEAGEWNRDVYIRQ